MSERFDAVVDLPQSFEEERVGGVPLLVSDLSTAVAHVLAASIAGESMAVHFCSAHTISFAHRDQGFRAALLHSDLRLSDGQWAVWVARSLSGGKSRLQKISGPDFFEAAFASSTEAGPRHYLLGGSPETLAALQRALSGRYPRAIVVGAESPPFRPLSDEEYAEQDERIRESGANIVWVGLGAPKQDWEAVRLQRSLGVTAIAIGAAFDFSAGTKRRAPAWMRQSGLEWLHRLCREPRRLLLRYLVGNSIFLWACLRRR